MHIGICSISLLYIFFSFPCLYILTSAVLYFCILYFSFLVPAYCHLQYFSFVYFILLSLFVDIVYSLLSFPHPYILTCAVFQFCIFHFTLLVSSYWHLQYGRSVYFTLLCLWILISAVFKLRILRSFPCINMCNIPALYILLCFPPLCILGSWIYSISLLYILLCFCRLCILHLPYFSSIYFALLFSSVDIDICSITVLYIFSCFFSLCILASAVFQFCKLYFAFFVCAYWHLQYFSFVYFTLLSLSVYIDMCSFLVL